MSAARKIVKGVVERLRSYPFFSKFNFRTAQSYQVMPTDLPYCGVYQLPEEQSPDGDLNVAEPRFRSSSIIGISVILRNTEAEELEDALDTAFDVIAIGLLEDPTFIGFAPAGTYDIEGIARVKRTHVFGSLGSTNECPTGELRLEFTFITKYDYPPDVRDELELIHLETAYPSLEEAGKVQQVVAPVDLRTVPEQH